MPDIFQEENSKGRGADHSYVAEESMGTETSVTEQKVLLELHKKKDTWRQPLATLQA